MRAKRYRTCLAATLALAAVGSGCTAIGTAPTSERGTQQLDQRPAVKARLQAAAEEGPSSLALRVLVLDEGSSWTEVLLERLQSEGMPFTRIDLTEADRPAITMDLLRGQEAGRAHGRFAALIAPNLQSQRLQPSERDALSAYQKELGVRLVETESWDEIVSRWPEPDLPEGQTAQPSETNPRYEGPIGGLPATLTAEASDGAFSYLQSDLTLDPGHDDTYGMLVPDPTRGSGGQFTPLLTAQIPGTTLQGALIGTETVDSRERMVMAFHADKYQLHSKLLAHGILRWATRDVSLSHFRSYFSVHADDIILPNTQWNIEHQCEIGRNCPPEVPTDGPHARVRMTPEDVDALVAWQQRSGVKVDMALNGAGAAQYAESHGGTDPLTDELVRQTEHLRWISHTFTHAFLGCQQELLPTSWRCQTDASGAIVWQPASVLDREITANQRFMAKMRLKNYSPDELITGEHSGLAKPPEQPEDNPHLAGALTRAGIKWIASDVSTESQPRRIGSATTVPRHPIDLDYNTPEAPQVVALYNWKNTSKAEGGSGDCETDPKTPCVAPLDLDRGFSETIVPMEADKVLRHMITDDPRPHFVHQSNLASDRLLYPVMDAAIQRRSEAYSASTPLLNPSISEAGQAVVDRDRWMRAQQDIEATIAGQRMRVTNRGAHAVRAPISLPEHTSTVSDGHLTGLFGEAYAGQRSSWVDLGPGQSIEFEVPRGTE